MKKFLKSKWGIVSIVAAGFVVLAGIAILINQLWYNAQPKFQDVTVELGAETVELQHFFTQYTKPKKAHFLTELSERQLQQAGDVPVTLRHGRREETVTLHIVDTTAPTASFLTERTVPAGYVPVPEDFVTDVFDLSQTKIFFTQQPEIPDDYRDLEVTVVVKDTCGNAIQQTCVLTYAWIYKEVILELGEYLTPAHILVEPEKDGKLLDYSQLVMINGAGVGEYSITCTAGTNTETCVITVQDTTPPTLVLEPVNINLNGRVKMEDFVVTAEDLSGEVTLELLTELPRSPLGTYPVEIAATDVWGNTVVGQTELRVVTDLTPPGIEGLSTLQTDKNVEPDYLTGVTAYDSRDGACEVTVSTKDVDLTKTGTYYAVYTAYDKSGNKATAKRKVVVNHDAADTAALVESIARKIGADPEDLRDYVRNNITYTGGWGGDDPVWYGFTNWAGNCYVHNLCLDALLKYYGYETQLIWVTDKTHYWLQIRLNGTWYHIDGTPGPVHTRFSLMNDEQRLWTLGGRTWDTSQWPACG